MVSRIATSSLTLVFTIVLCMAGLVAPAMAAWPIVSSGSQFVLAQAMVPPTGMNDATKPMPMDERMQKRFPQPVRVGDLIGLPVLDENASTLGYVRQVVRNKEGKINLIVSYSRWWGWFGHPVAVPLEVVGIEGRQLASLDMSGDDYEDADTWQPDGEATLPADAMIRIALART